MNRDFIDNAIIRAMAHDSLLDVSVLAIKGFSSGVMRRLISNLCEAAECYVEVGAYCGGTACAAINNKNVRAYIFEDFSQAFGDDNVREQLATNLNATRTNSDWELCLRNYLMHLPPFDLPVDIYFYDGEHSRESQAEALPWAFDRLAKRFLFVVDDSNWESVWHGTADGFKTLGDKVKILDQWKLIGKQRQDDPIWHNGMALFLCEKL